MGKANERKKNKRTEKKVVHLFVYQMKLQVIYIYIVTYVHMQAVHM